MHLLLPWAQSHSDVLADRWHFELSQPPPTILSVTAGLLCLKAAKAGGESSWSSSVSVHNELLRLGRQDLVETLAGDWWVDRKV